MIDYIIAQVLIRMVVQADRPFYLPLNRVAIARSRGIDVADDGLLASPLDALVSELRRCAINDDDAGLRLFFQIMKDELLGELDSETAGLQDTRTARLAQRQAINDTVIP